MPITIDDLTELAQNPKSVTGDSGSFTEHDVDDLLKLTAAAAGGEELEGANPQGGPRSAWKLMRRAQFSPGGGH